MTLLRINIIDDQEDPTSAFDRALVPCRGARPGRFMKDSVRTDAPAFLEHFGGVIDRKKQELRHQAFVLCKKCISLHENRVTKQIREASFLVR